MINDYPIIWEASSIIFNKNNTAITYTATETSFDFPAHNFMNAKLNIPNTIPSAIL